MYRSPKNPCQSRRKKTENVQQISDCRGVYISVKHNTLEYKNRTETNDSNVIFYRCNYFSYFFFQISYQESMMPADVVCSVLHLAVLPTGVRGTWWVLIQRQLAALMDDQPPAFFFLPSFLSKPAKRAADVGEKKGGEERISSG